MTEKPDRQIAAIEKNSRERISIALRSYKGKRFCDVRLYVVNADSDYVPTNKGMGIRPELLAQTITALQEARAAAIEEGLIDG